MWFDRLLQGFIDTFLMVGVSSLIALLAVVGSPLSADELRQRAGNWAQQVEVLGYVV